MNHVSETPPLAALQSRQAAGNGGAIGAVQGVFVEDVGSGSGGGLAAPPPVLKKRSTTFIGKLAGGDNDHNKTLNMIGTDLGVSFQRGNQLYFLFGDSWTPDWFLNGWQDLDSIGWTSAARPDGVPALTWERGGDSKFHPLSLPGFNPMSLMSVPVEGLVVGSTTYIFFYNSAGKTGEIEPWLLPGQTLETPGGETQQTAEGEGVGEGGEGDPQEARVPAPVRSVLARAVGDDFKQLEPVHDEQSTRFLSVSAIVEGDTVYIFGAGSYRDSAVYLAKVAANDFADRRNWRYYAGPDDWRTNEGEAAELFDDSDQPTRACTGELSVRKYESKGLYFMAYNCGTRERTPGDFALIPQKVLIRTARSPEGPWSASEIILTAEDGFGTTIHGHTEDGLGEAHLADWPPTEPAPVPRNEGDVYGPYLIPQWFSENAAGEYEIIYTISTWNPYHVYLVKTVLGEM